LVAEERTVVIYESPHRLKKLLGQLAEAAGHQRQAVIARELSKKFEEFQRGTLAELFEWAESQTRIRGEIVLVLGSEKTSERMNQGA
jgi:16S rRNA (cytidine1402-2'-O)-methyltransferase